MTKTYNTPKRNHVIKTRLNDEEYEFFLQRIKRKRNTKVTVKDGAMVCWRLLPVSVAASVHDIGNYEYIPTGGNAYGKRSPYLAEKQFDVGGGRRLFRHRHGQAARTHQRAKLRFCSVGRE